MEERVEQSFHHVRRREGPGAGLLKMHVQACESLISGETRSGLSRYSPDNRAREALEEIQKLTGFDISTTSSRTSGPNSGDRPVKSHDEELQSHGQGRRGRACRTSVQVRRGLHV